MSLILHGTEISTAYRATVLALRALDIEFEHREVNILKGGHLTPEYLRLNPLHTVPALEDGHFVIWDSHVINSYLVGKYGKDDSLYPKDLQKRAVVDQRMLWDCGVLFFRAAEAVSSMYKKGASTVEKQYEDSLLDYTLKKFHKK